MTIDIYFNDLKEETQREVLEAAGVKTPQEVGTSDDESLLG